VIREDALGEFLRAEEPETGEPVCLRRLHARLAGDDAARMLFAEELRRIATLSHPGLVRVRRSDRNASRPWAVTDPIDDGTLEDDLAATGPWAREPARRFVVSLLGALEQLEARHQFHAALHPSRLVRVRGSFRLTTFREIRAEDEAPRLKGREPVDPRFAAPELAADDAATVKARPLTAFAVGALWRWLRTGRAPGEGAIPGVDDADGAWIERLLEDEPMLRPAGAESLRRLLVADGPDSRE
jgi:hypothetical protein